MEFCPNCHTPYPTKQQAFDCCIDVQGAKIDLTYGNSKQSFIRSVEQMELELGDQSVTKKQFQRMITPKQYGQFLWETFKRYGAITQQQLADRVNVFLRNLVMQRLCNKGIVQATSVNQQGSMLYRPTKNKRIYWGLLNQAQKKVLQQSFGAKVQTIYGKKG